MYTKSNSGHVLTLDHGLCFTLSMANAPAGYLSAFARMSHVLELRRAGKSYQQIADIVGLSKPEKAQALVTKAIKRVLRETAEEVRSIELSRLELLIKVLWDKALADVEKEDPDYRRFDRLKGLLESKLRWCGAQEVLDHSDKNVTIIVQSFTKNISNVNGSMLAPSPVLIEELVEPER